MNWLRFGRPRKIILWLSVRIWKHNDTPDWLLNFLYPDDCEIVFKLLENLEEREK